MSAGPAATDPGSAAIALSRSVDGRVTATRVGTRPGGGAGPADGSVPAENPVPVADLPAYVTGHPGVRWVWDDTAQWYPSLLAAGVRVSRCHDLRLAHAILRHSELTAGSALALAPDGPWDAPNPVRNGPPDGLFELDRPPAPDPVAEYAAQLTAISGASDPGRIGLLVAAESAGALVAAELNHAGLPWDAAEHDRVLTALLGPRPAAGQRPERLAELAETIRTLLDAPDLNPDSQPALLRALANAGLQVTSTGRWELREIDHPVIEPLLRYKRLARLLSANGWHWLDTWVRDGRFRANFVPGAVVTGRWGSDGGGALQLPREIRSAAVADPGWKLVVADAGQLEPRVLAGLARDVGLAQAGHGDLYDGIVASGAVASRDEAKVAMLGAMYGATTGDSARIMPRLARAYPRAIQLVEDAARTGERGGVVSTLLGRTSPPPDGDWARRAGTAVDGPLPATDSAQARSRSRAWGRFTRNFVVQGTAAEWALCWMGALRARLWELGHASRDEAADPGTADPGTADPIAAGPHLVFFLHDELVIHSPAGLAEEVAEAAREAAAEAGRMLFGDGPLTFPLTVAIVDAYSEAK